jgi:bacillithiol biosynthesis deacetylase BshB1
MDPEFVYDALVLGAHPDDAEMGMGGTVAALTQAGRRVMLLSLTRGEMGSWGDPAQRAREAEAAAQVLGCEHRILELPDSAVCDDQPTRRLVATLLRELRPRLLFAPYPHNRASHLDGRANVDHLAAGLLAREGSKLARLRKVLPELEPHAVQRLFYYMIPESTEPSFLVDVSAHEEALTRSILAYESQMGIGRGSRKILELLLLWRRSLGQRLHVELAESFVCEDALGGDAELLFSI